MSDYIDTREGWRETDMVEWKSVVDGIRFDGPDGPRFWVREEPVPPLPTDPYTVIRVAWIETADEDLPDLWVCGEDQWAAVESEQWASRDWFYRSITGFKVLSEARAVTAKAVLDRVQAIHPTPMQSTELTRIARGFGVDQ